jgi:hypothetical protein
MALALLSEFDYAIAIKHLLNLVSKATSIINKKNKHYLFLTSQQQEEFQCSMYL